MTIRNEWDLADMENKGIKEDAEMFRVSGCGISAIGLKGSESLLWVMNRIIEKGDFPKVERV